MFFAAPYTRAEYISNIPSYSEVIIEMYSTHAYLRERFGEFNPLAQTARRSTGRSAMASKSRVPNPRTGYYHGGARPGAGRRPLGYGLFERPEWHEPPKTSFDERFWVDGAVLIPHEGELADKLRALRDQVLPTLLKMRLVPRSERGVGNVPRGFRKNMYKRGAVSGYDAEFFWVEGSAFVSEEDEDHNDMRAARDTAAPLLRLMGLDPVTARVRDDGSVPERRKWPHHNKVDAYGVASVVYNNSGLSLPELAEKVYRKHGPETWTPGDQEAAENKLKQRLRFLSQHPAIVSRRFSEEKNRIVFVPGPGYDDFAEEYNAQEDAPKKESRFLLAKED